MPTYSLKAIFKILVNYWILKISNLQNISLKKPFSLSEFERFGYFLVFLFIIGVSFAFYFSNIEIVLFFLLLIISGFFVFIFEIDDLFGQLNMMILAFLLGFFYGLIADLLYQEKFVHHYIKNAQISGVVDEVDANKIILSDVKIVKKNAKENKYWDENGNYLHKIDRISLKNNLKQDVLVGDRIISKIEIYPPFSPAFAGFFDLRKRAKFLSISGYGKFVGDDYQVIKGQSKIFHLRQKIINKINLVDLSDDKKSLIIALIVGDKSYIGDDLMDKVRYSGLAHVLAISGMHMAIICGIFFFLILNILSFNFNLTLRFNIRKIAAFLTILFGFGYLFLVDFSISATRSFLMLSLFLVAIMTDFYVNIWRILFVIAGFLVIFFPYLALDAGFIMSFLAVISLAGLFEKIKIGFDNRFFYQRFINYFLALILSSLAVFVILAVVLLYYFNYLSFLSNIANFYALPLLGFMIMPLLLMFLALMVFNLHIYLLPLINFVFDYLLAIIYAFGDVSFGVVNLGIIDGFLVCLVVIFLVWFFLFKSRFNKLALFLAVLTFTLMVSGKKNYDLILDRRIVAFKDQGGWNLVLDKSDFKKSLVQKKLNIDNFSNFDCQNSCDIKIKDKNLLLVFNGKDGDCRQEYDYLVNFSKQVIDDSCFNNSTIFIDKSDLRGSGFLISL